MSIQRNLKIATIAIILITLISFPSISIIVIAQSNNSIKTVNIDVYSDLKCTQQLTSIDYGNVNAGENITKTIYIKNTGNSPMILSKTTANWSSLEAELSLKLSWNRNNYALPGGKSVSAIVTLNVAPNIVGFTDFGLTLTFTGTPSK